ncbi:transcription antitermination factor NusB [Chitinophaga sp. GCM10012297]|uniref:Transcription antitermination protein NusB n=1 Tax=Chitinophaga chungangae TaxID=2821488 RepID=A0ABS3Y9W3_9BACT|nr:transcription antitermination factor NusB [Chitinophaga chungangae]MBO9151421.1 transcription antitermination factor NusB [Chitinophaga chungangae]
MISRRNIRVKVMQTLYAMDTMEQETVKPGTATGLLNEKLDQTCQIFTYILYTLARVAQYAETDAQARAGKHLPSAEDLAVNTKIAGNDFVFQVLQDKGFQVNLDTWKLRKFEDQDLIRRLYNQLAESETYKTYIAEPSRDKASEKHIVEYIYRHILEKNELFRQHMEDSFLHWGDDEDMMGILVGNYLSKPQLFNFLQLISREKLEYARDLLTTVINKKDYCMELIKPKLQNWDPERIAAVDMLLMEMGVCEFLYFPTIPTKVSINEYIDLAKAYSTPQSGQFVNGILDNILKDLVQANLVEKTDRNKK